jgi:hypothetical protein
VNLKIISAAASVPALALQAAVMLGRQSMLWVVARGDVRAAVPAVASGLGLAQEEAAKLVEKMPVLLACEAAWLRLK